MCIVIAVALVAVVILRRIGHHGQVVHIGADYPPGAATLNALLGVSTAPPPPAEPAGRISVGR